MGQDSIGQHFARPVERTRVWGKCTDRWLTGSVVVGVSSNNNGGE